MRATLAEWLKISLQRSRFRGNQRALAAASGVSRETIWRVLQAKSVPQARTIEALAEAMEVEVPTGERAGVVRESDAFYGEPGGVESQLTEDEALALLVESRPRFVRYLQARFGDQPLPKGAKLDHLAFILRLARERNVPVSPDFVAAVRALIEQGGL